MKNASFMKVDEVARGIGHFQILRLQDRTEAE